MKNYIFPAIKITIAMLFAVLFYTILSYGGSKILPNGGEAETMTHNGKKYYINVGQKFTSPKYFHGRPSAVDYKADGSGASNKGPSNQEYLAEVQKRVDSIKVENPEMGDSKVPVELVTASGSGLDPDISVDGALYQVKRISKERNIPEEKIIEIINKTTEAPVLHAFGPSKVNVLKLNLALEQM